MAGDTNSPLIVLPAHSRYIDRVATDTLAHITATGRQLHDCLFVVNHAAMVAPLRDRLSSLQLAQAPALLGPRILPYRVWLQEAAGAAIESRSIQELRLLDILHEFPRYFDREKSWQYCDNLLVLFDALQQAGTVMDAPDARHEGAAWKELQGLSREQRTVELLYHHWLDSGADATRYAAIVLAAHRYQAGAPETVVVAGFDELTRFESELLVETLEATGGLAFFGEYDRLANPVIHALTAPLSSSTAQRDWVTELGSPKADGVQSPTGENWRVDAAIDEEHEAQVIVRRISGLARPAQTTIGVVSENRRLLRRIHALLDMRGIPTRDYAGWPLATVSAATLPQRLLDCVESRFHYKPLLDLLRSPCLPVATTSGSCSGHQVAELLERRIVARGGIRRHLTRYRDGLERHLADNPTAGERWHALQATLTRLDSASGELQAMHSADAASAHQFVTALRRSLEALDAWGWLDDDPAGTLIVRLISMLERCSAGAPTRALTWRELRTWFNRALEEQHFVPPVTPNPDSAIKLMSLREAVYLQFDTLFVAGANDQYLPGNPQGLTRFFNERTCEQLGIRSRRHFRDLALWRLRALLQRSQDVFISYACEEGSELLQPGGWVPAMAIARAGVASPTPFDYGAVYARDIDTADRDRLARTPAQPRVSLREARLPTQVSASTHQKLVDCPYLFYTARVLGISAPDEARDRLEKSDYGNLVHRSLKRFHEQADTTALIAEDPTAAIARLSTVSEVVFAHDIADNFEHRAWYRRWQRCIADYIRWQAQRTDYYDVLECEATRSRPLERDLVIQGKLDRVDRIVENGRTAVIDYKTGRAAGTPAIESGEDVQLLTYALLEQDPGEVTYLKLDGGTARTTGGLNGEALMRARDAVGERLLASFTAIRAGRAMPAWKNARCRVCEMSGVCRADWWQ